MLNFIKQSAILLGVGMIMSGLLKKEPTLSNFIISTTVGFVFYMSTIRFLNKEINIRYKITDNKLVTQYDNNSGNSYKLPLTHNNSISVSRYNCILFDIIVVTVGDTIEKNDSKAYELHFERINPIIAN